MFFDRFKQICTEKGVSTTAVVEAVGMNRSAVTYWKKSGTTPKADVVKKIADYLGVSVEQLMLDADEELTMLLYAEPVEVYNHLSYKAEQTGTDLYTVAANNNVKKGEVDLLRRNRRASKQAITILYNAIEQRTIWKSESPAGPDIEYIHKVLTELNNEELRRVASFLRLMFPDKNI